MGEGWGREKHLCMRRKGTCRAYLVLFQEPVVPPLKILTCEFPFENIEGKNVDYKDYVFIENPLNVGVYLM